jgi:hypothetical protein
MSYPNFYPFKTRVLNATSTTSNVIMSVAVPARAFLVDAFYNTTPQQTHTAVGTADITVNGTTAGIGGGATGWTGLTVTTSTGNSSTRLGTLVGNASTVYLNSGDVLATVLSSVVGGNTTFVVREY